MTVGQTEKEVLLVATIIVYKYRAPGALPDDDVTLRSETHDLDLREAEAVHRVGQSFMLQGEEYMVVDQTAIPAQWEQPGSTLATLYVIVTKPEVDKA